MRLPILTMALAFAVSGFADTVILKDGRAIRGNYLGGSPRQVKIEAGDQIQTFDSRPIRLHGAGFVRVDPFMVRSVSAN